MRRIARRLLTSLTRKAARNNEPSAPFQRLPDGLRVASEPVPGQYCTIGVVISAGARHSARYPPGTCHLIEKLAFSRSLNYPSRELINKLLEECGALIDCQTTRDTFIYASSCHKRHAHRVLHLIADAVQRPLIEAEDMDAAGDAVRYENENMDRQPECEPLLTDWIHAAAFRNNTLGLSKYCSSTGVEAVRREHLYAFASQYFTPTRMVVAGVGVESEPFTTAAGELFASTEAVWDKQPSLQLDKMPEMDDSLAQYTGGEMRVSRDLSQMALGPTPFPNLAHLVIGFQGVSLSDPDFVPFCVLQSLLGGGGSFSAGGPGKGMYTRLYTEVLYYHGWIYNATAYNHSYADGGLFCVRASAPPEKLDELPAVLFNEFARLDKKNDLHREELERAKVQLKSQLMMNLEMRPVIFEDLARQILAHDERRLPQYYAERIDQVTVGDIKRVVRRMLNSKLSLVGYGDLRRLLPYERIAADL